MEGPEGDSGAPDSWELADLDERMSRLLASSSSSRKIPPPEFVDESSSLQAAAVGQVDQFLREALEKPRERLAILRMEQEIEKFIRDPTQQQLELQPQPNSYLRLAAHRIAQHYSLQSIAMPDNSSPDGSSSRIFLHKTSLCRFPPIRLADIPVNLPKEEGSNMVKVAIKRRPHKYSQNAGSADAHSSKMNQLKSVEERKEEYNRARARIFSSISGSNNDGRADEDIALTDVFQHSPMVSSQSEEKPVYEPTGLNIGQGSNESLGGSSRSSRGKTENEPTINRYKVGNRVAIFRDREMDRKDPDYDRNYDRWAYGIQPLYTPAVNYNTEFPQLGSSHLTQMSIEHQQRPMPQHPHVPWGAGSPSATVGYGPPEGLLPPFNSSPVGPLSNPSIYLPSSQYLAQPRGPRPGMSFIHPQEHAQPFSQTHQQQSEASFGLSRPR
ncbi:unnamed protein product [Spirodela intermedia]|uniref:Uncharacterized protein n=1 Tax=Spirodela intermedia TaxID=51605 RepID=A0A7I8JM21_SPIIN|nr:unnamed protein product [Spirodela intermedia]CAA6671206.1 unnamed protein product [Spirodela intermedia]